MKHILCKGFGCVAVVFGVAQAIIAAPPVISNVSFPGSAALYDVVEITFDS
ncbi:hypothetical protein HQ563_01355, partial [bacterium]|nr:hypothetical protein [bacterium]